MASLPEGYKAIPEEDRKKAKVFFDRGNTVAGTGNYDYAIEMYISGLAIDPDAVEAHQTLHDIALKRKASGGKASGFMEAMKLKRPTKDDKQNLLNYEKLAANDPGNTDYLIGMVQNALRGGFFDTVMWVGPLLQRAVSESPKPDVQKFIILRDAYKYLQQWKLATDACHYAAMLRPDDMELQNELKNLGAMDTMRKGNYGQSGSFRDSIKDMDAQGKLLKEDKDVRTMDQLGGMIKDAAGEWKAHPDDYSKLTKYVDVLVKTEQTEYENVAIDELEKTYNITRQFRFRQKVGQIRMSQMHRMERSLRQSAAANPTDIEAKQSWSQFYQEMIQEELGEYKLWSENYPTDASFKYETAVRLYQLQRFDEAIPVLQNVRNDPKYKVIASVALGRAFLDAGYVDESAETLGAVINDYLHKGDKKSIDMTYWYGRALEEKKDFEGAIKAYSQVTQWDFNFKDVQTRIKKLRELAKNLPL